MRFHSLRIANYRGITSAEVKFSPVGITLVKGPNEVGKTSLGEAVEILFDYPDSSKKRNIEAIKPVHRDEGPEIELEAESGPYTFTYFKRFYKKPETRLTITRPKRENLIGREAHERAESILRETIDINLWKALTIQQGDAIHQPDLSHQTSLSTALDKAAGGHTADSGDEDLFDIVREEYLRYHTEAGAERKELKESRNAEDDAKEKVAQIRQAIHNLDNDTENAAFLKRDLDRLKIQEHDLRKEVAALEASLEELRLLESALTAARFKLESTQKSEQVARRDKLARESLIEEVAKVTKEHSDIESSGIMSLASLNQAEVKLTEAHKSYDESEQKRKAADSLAALRRADCDYYKDKLDLEQIRERKARIDQARKNAAHAEAVLKQNKVDKLALDKIQEAERELLTATAKFAAGAPNVLLRGLSNCRLLIDEEEVMLGDREIRTLSVAEKTKVTIPGSLDIEITAGTSADRLTRKVEEARHLLESACAAAGIAKPDDVNKAFEERREASQHIKDKTQIEKENLRDLTYAELENKLLNLQQTVPAYLANRIKKPIICSDLDSAKKERTSAEAAQQKANGEWENARDALDTVRRVQESLKTKHQESRIQLDMLSKNLRQLQENLNNARKNAADTTLESRLKETSQAVAMEEDRVHSAEATLKSRDPDRVETMADTARGSLKTTQNQRSAAHDELTKIQGRLSAYGEEGLHEKLHLAQICLERVEQENKAQFRRASAAKYLFNIMREERDKARQAYLAPLKEMIESLGRLVYDDTFHIDIDENLQITSRTTNGTTVPFESLSGGTKEQLSLIFRLACAKIVAEDGGAPLILDDALGYTDQERLHSMGAVLAKAAKDCQIIIFTCVPDRYSNIGEASVVSLQS